MWHWGKRRGMILMRILIYGAGVIGSLYAALFAEAGYDTSIYARGKRFEALRNNGLLYKKNQEINPKELSSFQRY
jgi:2-dehydropantoate 2-reductase